MRVSTSMMYDLGRNAMQRQSSDFLHTQQQLASGRRVLNPSDDPVSAARALEVAQSKSVNTQFQENQGYAKDNLALVESKLGGIGDILSYVRTRAVESGNAIHTQAERNAIAADVRAQFGAMLGIANSQDGAGDFLFGGYRSDAAPFADSGSLDVNYTGDAGERTMQVSASRLMPVGVSGEALFRSLPVENAVSVYSGNGNGGTTSLTLAMSPLPPDPATLGKRYELRFDGTGYQTIDLSDNSPVGVAGPVPTIPGVSVSITGPMSPGDSFEVFVASDNVFDNMALFIDALENPGPSGTVGMTAFALETLDAASENVLTLRSAVGSRLGEIEALEGLSGGLDVQYADTLSRLQDLDYNEAISRFSQQQTLLEAAQQSFVKVTGLSLFDYLR